jgi:hypothetical protein
VPEPVELLTTSVPPLTLVPTVCLTERMITATGRGELLMRWFLALPIRKHQLASVCAAVLLMAATGASQSPQAGGASPAPSASAASATPTVATTPPKPVLKLSVTLVGANDSNDALSLAAPLGAPVSLILVVKEPPAGHPRGGLRIFPFLSQGEQPAAIATAKIHTGESNATATESTPVTLDKPGQIAFSLEFDRLRPGKTYKGQLFLTSADLLHHWDITLTTEGRGTVAVDPVGTLKFVTLPWKTETGSFSFTLYDKSEGGPYHHVRVRFEPSPSANSKALTSNFVLDTLSFWENDKRIDLARRGANAQRATDEAVTLTKARTFTTRVESLSPGEYSGMLHFAADETSDDAADARLPLLIQVRDVWWLPVVVILIGSVFGWFSSKYVVGAGKARDLSRQVKELRARADSLAHRSSIPRGGWEFPSEAVSLGFARLGITLNRLAKLTASAVEVLFRADEIEQLRQGADLRLGALESLRDTRLLVQSGSADGRPAAELAITHLLRSATDLLDQPTFGATEQANLTKLLDAVKTWADDRFAPFVDAYQQAILARRRGNDCPDQQDIDSLDEKLLLIRTQLKDLVKLLPDEPTIKGQTALTDLGASDKKVARTLLLWRERNQPWSDALAGADKAGEMLDKLFQLVDAKFWEALKIAANNGELVLDRKFTSQEKPRTYEVVEIDLKSDTPGFEVQRLRDHPMRVRWRIESPPRGAAVRTTETDGLTLVQYFPSAGNVTVSATLCWEGQKIPIPIETPQPGQTETRNSFEVVANPEYGKRWRFITEWTQYAAIAVAALFAIVTAMGTQYDSTFGTMTQYLTMFVWAAGAGTGGNLFSQLGASSAPGGAAATLK